MEFLNSEREGRSENREEEKYEQNFVRELEDEEEKQHSQRAVPVMHKREDYRHRELESSEEDYSEDANTTYYRNMQETAKRLRHINDDEEESKSFMCMPTSIPQRFYSW